MDLKQIHFAVDMDITSEDLLPVLMAILVQQHGPQRVLEAWVRAAVSAPPPPSEKEQDDSARVDGVPEGAHGDLPRPSSELNPASVENRKPCSHQYWDLGHCIDCYKTQNEIDEEKRHV